MSGKPHMSKKEKKLKQKSLIQLLSQNPIVETACKKIGISRMMYYRWRKADHSFAKEVDLTLSVSRETVNDLAVSKLIGHMQEGQLKSIIYWLQHNHPRYMKNDQRAWQEAQERKYTNTEDPLRERLNFIKKIRAKREKQKNKNKS